MTPYRRWTLAWTLLLSTSAAASAQGIALPPVRGADRGVEIRRVTVPVQRADTIVRTRSIDEVRGLRADDTINESGKQYRILDVDPRTGRVRAVQEVTVTETVEVLTRTEKPCTLAGSGRYRGFPTRSKDEAECFWGRDGLTALNSANLSGSKEARSVVIDLASDFIGPVMTYVSASIAAADSADDEADEGGAAEENRQEANVQRFLTNGGNAVLGFLLAGPTFQTYGVNDSGSPSFTAFAVLAPRIGFDVPSANSSLSNPKVNVDLGPELTLLAEGDQLAVYSQVRLAQVFGSPEFFESIGRKNESFGYGRINVGLRLNLLNDTRLLLTWSKPFSGPSPILRSGSQLQFTLQQADTKKGDTGS